MAIKRPVEWTNDPGGQYLIDANGHNCEYQPNEVLACINHAPALAELIREQIADSYGTPIGRLERMQDALAAYDSAMKEVNRDE